MLRSILLFTAFFMMSPVAKASTSIHPNKKVKINWNAPTLIQVVDHKHARVAISGKAKPGTTIQLESGAVSIDSHMKVQPLTNKKLAPTAKQIKVRSDGKFKMLLTLPFKNVQLPFVATTDSSHKQQFVLLMKVRQNKISIVGQKSHPTWTFIIGPKASLLQLNQTSSSVTAHSTAVLIGSTFSAGYRFNKNYRGQISLSSLQLVGDLPTGSKFTFSDFESSLAMDRRVSPYWWLNVGAIIDSTPFFTHDSSANYVYNQATLNRLAFGLHANDPLTENLVSHVGFGILFGLATSSAFTSNASLLGSYIQYAFSYEFVSHLLAKASAAVEYDSFEFSNYDPSAAATVKNTMAQVGATATAGLEYQF